MQLPCLNWTKANLSSLQVGTQVSACTLHTLELLPKKEEERAVRLLVNDVLLPLPWGALQATTLEAPNEGCALERMIACRHCPVPLRQMGSTPSILPLCT